MKYIRTKAGEIYNIDDLYVCEELNGKPYGVKNSSWVIYKESIIKQADTIEELCDEFVLEDRKDKVNRHFTKLELVPCIYCFDKQNTTVYGAIWTDKGLIFVARMNSKGELELL